MMRILAFVAAMTLACHPPTPPAVITVEIIVSPATGGMAQFSVNRDGRIRGGHLSGGPEPFVHQDDGQLDKPVIDSLWSLVRRLQDSLPAETSPEEPGRVTLQLGFDNETSWSYSWRAEARTAPDAKVDAVAQWLFKHKIGGW